MSFSSIRPSFSRFGCINAVKGNGEKVEVVYQNNQNLFEVLTTENILSEKGSCMGNTACGRCMVKVLNGEIPPPEDEEKEILGDAPSNIRLSCAISLNNRINGATFQII